MGIMANGAGNLVNHHVGLMEGKQGPGRIEKNRWVVAAIAKCIVTFNIAQGVGIFVTGDQQVGVNRPVRSVCSGAARFSSVIAVMAIGAVDP